DLQTIVAVKMDTSLQSKIVFVPMETGKPSSEISAFDQGFISFPKWVNDNEIIYFSRLNRVATLYHYNLQTKEHSTIIPPTTHLINHPYVQGNKVIFTATYDGTDQIYSVDLDTKLVHQLTHESIGAYTPNLMGDTLTYQTLISKGADLRQSLISKGKSIDIHERGDIQGDVNIVDDIKNTDYTPSNYNRLWRLQLHSYAPSQNLSTPGIQLYFENALSNIGGTTEIYYNINEKTIQGNTSISLSHRYPVFALNIAPASRASFAFVQDSNKLKRYTFSEMNYGLSTQVPLRWVDGNMSRIFRPSLGINYKHIYNKQVLFTPKALNSFTNISLGLSMSNLRRFAPQNVGTRWGQEININYRASLHGPKGEAFQVRGNVYIPGILQNHRIKIGGEFYKEEFLNTYKFSNNFQYVRGGSALPYNAARRLSLDYGLPLFYPEIGIFDITYFKRIRLNIFGDMAAMKVTSRTLRAQSVGAELYFDNVWMNTLPLTFGARLSYVEEEGDKMWKPELIFALDL
ncbi:MAG TPA: hypothetical protein PKD85_06050, partial [Saprospiraceae bacterium]|nr:hypothetical protein [Saprospiraceae bacterium]